MAVRFNTDRINYAYDTKFGRFRKTIGDYILIAWKNLETLTYL